MKLTGFHRVATAALPLISDSGTGRIINIAGQTARTLVPNAGVTGITNAAVIALTSYLASEGAARHVLVNAISPGMTLTEGWTARHEAMAAQQGTSGEAVRDGMAKGLGIRPAAGPARPRSRRRPSSSRPTSRPTSPARSSRSTAG